jgi:hypothetical protein
MPSRVTNEVTTSFMAARLVGTGGAPSDAAPP